MILKESGRPMLNRARDVYVAAGVPRGTPWVRPDLSGWRWRVSPDVMVGLKVELDRVLGLQPPTEWPGQWTLFSIRLDEDADLPVNAMLLEFPGGYDEVFG